MATAPPSKTRPTWTTVTTVEPKANESGSACVACWPIGSLVRSAETCRDTTSQSRWTTSVASAVTMSRPGPQATRSRVPSPCAGTRSSPLPAAIVSRPGPPRITSAPVSPRSVSFPRAPVENVRAGRPFEVVRSRRARDGGRGRQAREQRTRCEGCCEAEHGAQGSWNGHVQVPVPGTAQGQSLRLSLGVLRGRSSPRPPPRAARLSERRSSGPRSWRCGRGPARPG